MVATAGATEAQVLRVAIGCVALPRLAAEFPMVVGVCADRSPWWVTQVRLAVRVGTTGDGKLADGGEVFRVCIARRYCDCTALLRFLESVRLGKQLTSADCRWHR